LTKIKLRGRKIKEPFSIPFILLLYAIFRFNYFSPCSKSLSGI